MAEIVDFGLQQHKIKMDNSYFDNGFSVVAGDTGRRVEVQLLDTNSMVQNTTGLNLRLNAKVAGKSTFTDATLVDAESGLYRLDLSNGMFLVPGNWEFQWQITDSTGKKLHGFSFRGNVGSNISEGGAEATNFYLNLEDLKAMQEDLVNGTIDSSILETTITEKLTNLETQYAPKLTEVTAQLAQNANSVKRVEEKVQGIDRGYGDTYDTLEELNNSIQADKEKRYVVSADGNWYYWNESSWFSGGVFQATGLPSDISGFSDILKSDADVPIYMSIDEFTKYSVQDKVDDSYVYSVYSYKQEEKETELVNVGQESVYIGLSDFASLKSNNRVDDSLIYFVYADVPEIAKLSEEEIVAVHFGDSITEGGIYHQIVAKKLGITTYNLGFGGCRMADVVESHYGYGMNGFSMVSVAEAIATRNFSKMDSSLAFGIANGDNNTAIVALLKSIDFTKVNIITIFYGTNDYSGNVPLGTESDMTANTYLGAINLTIKYLSETYPHIKIAFITPLWRARLSADGDGKDSDTTPNNTGAYLINYVDKEIKVVNKNSYPALDLYRNSGINKYNYKHYLADGLHPNNEVGSQHIGNKTTGFLSKEFGMRVVV